MEAYFQSEVSLPSVERKANLCSTCEHGFQITQWYEWIAKLSYCQMWNSSWNVMQMFFSFTRTFKCCSWTSCIFFFTQRASPVVLKCLLTFSDARSHWRIYCWFNILKLLQHYCDWLDLSDWQNVVIFKSGPISYGYIPHLIFVE